MILPALVLHCVTRLSFLSGWRSRRGMDTRLQPRGRRPPSSGIQRRLHYEGERSSQCTYNRSLYPCSPPPQEVLVIPEQERVLFQSHAGVAAGARAPEAEV